MLKSNLFSISHYSGDTSDGLPGFTIKGITDLFKGNYFSLIFGMFWHCLKSKGPVAFDNSNFALPLAQRLLELGFETDEDNPVWEWKYGDLSKVYIKIFKKDQFKWQQRFRWFSVGICKYKPGYKSHDLHCCVK